MKEIEHKINKLLNYSEYFNNLKNNEEFLYKELNDIKTNTINLLKDNYKNKEKINEIRSLIVEKIGKNEIITKEKLNQIKDNVNEKNPKNILQSWKKDFSILHTFFYLTIKEEVENYLNEIGNELIKNLKLNNVELKIQGFDGAQNFGSDHCWIAIYNNQQKNQSTSLQLFIKFDKDNILYGLFRFLSENQFLSKFEIKKEELNFQNIIENLRNNVKDIVNDNEYIPKLWKFSPGENAKYWKEMKLKRIASIGWGNFNFVNKSAEKIKELDSNQFGKSSKSPNIINNINKIMVGDYLLAFKGKTTLIGYGIVTKGAEYAEEAVIENSNNHNFLSVKWFEFKEYIECKKVHRNTINDINARRDEFLKLIADHEILLEEKELNQNKEPLNQILYGPPGTGKTYNTINKALEILGVDTSNKTRNELMDEFKRKKADGQIEFVTFHQSYGYEEFVEGIKADLQNEGIRYKLESGIFKELSLRASKKQEIDINLNNIDFSQYLEVGQELYSKHGKKITIKSIDEDIIFTNDTGSEAKADRVKMIERLNNEALMLSDDYYSAQVYIAREIYRKLNKKDSKPKNYILIIDEINRGNISKIFGELITLIEPSKRIGEEEGIMLTLPNSKELFGVPSNLYIIGTMNTADRSIAQIDTALRRRFVFEEMIPKPKLLVNEDNKLIIIDKKNEETDINVVKILTAINERIEYIYDREHTIGHSYFMPLIKTPTIEKLDEIFRVNIIPLLAEYFYGDWEDIKFVLNNNFIEEKKDSKYIKGNSSGRTLNKVYEINKKFRVDQYKEIYKSYSEENKNTSKED